MTKVDKKVFDSGCGAAETFSSMPVKTSEDTQRPDIEYHWIGDIKIGEVRHKGQANEEFYLYD